MVRTLRVDRLKYETPNAVAVEDTYGKIIWLPKSQIQIPPPPVQRRDYVEILLPEWLADKHPTLEYDEEVI